MNEQPVQVYRERDISPFAAMGLFFVGIALLIGFIAALIVSWHSFVAEASLIVRLLLIVAALVVCLSLISAGLYRGYMAWLKAQHAREELDAVRDERQRAQQRHAVEMHLLQTRLPADERGNRAAIIHPITGEIIVPLSGNFVQNVPAHYAPHITYPATRITEEKDSPMQIAAPTVVQPAMDYVLSLLRMNALQVCLGVSATTGKPFVLDLIDGVHYKFIGSSGMGKSCMAGALLDQATQTNDADHLMISLLDLEHKTSRLFEHLPHVAELPVGRRRVSLVATDADEVAAHLGYLHSELDKRKAMNEYDLARERFLLIYVEEFLSLKLEVDERLKAQMLKDFTILAVRGRKYGMYLMACAQDDYAEDDKDFKSAKNQFQVKGAFAVNPSAARSAGFVMGDLIKQNYEDHEPGRYVLETRGCNDIMLAPIYDLKAKLGQFSRGPESRQPGRSDPFTEPNDGPPLRLLNGGRTLSERPANEIATEDERATEATQARLSEVRKLRGQGWGKQAIIEKVWYPVKKGSSRAYQEAEAAYESMIAYIEEGA